MFEIEMEGGEGESKEGEDGDYVSLVKRILLGLGESDKRM